MNDTWDHELTLISHTPYSSTSTGVRIPSEATKNVILAKKRPVPGIEFYQAGQSGITITQLFVVHPFEYNGETELEFEGNLYKVVRTYQTSDDEMELSCEMKVGKKNGN